MTPPNHPVFSGSRASMQTADGRAQHYFENAPVGLKVGAGDTLFAYVYLDPARPPREIMLQWFTGGWDHRAYWGDNVIPFGRDASTERVHMGPLPEAGKWVRLEVETPGGDPARNGHSRLGVHAARGHRLLGQSRHCYADSAGRNYPAGDPCAGPESLADRTPTWPASATRRPWRNSPRTNRRNGRRCGRRSPPRCDSVCPVLARTPR